jgi:hypothetical protein
MKYYLLLHFLTSADSLRGEIFQMRFGGCCIAIILQVRYVKAGSAYVAGLFFPSFPTARMPNTALSLLIGRIVVFSVPTFNMCVHYFSQLLQRF